MLRFDIFDMSDEADILDFKTREKAANYQSCMFELYNEFRGLVKHQSGKTAEDAYELFCETCSEYDIDPVG